MSWILLVDDDPIQLRIRAELLHAAGFEVSTASSGSTALALAIATAPDLGAIVTDHLLTGSTGADLFREARADGVRAPVIVLTGLPDVHDEYKGMNVRILHKPIPAVQLISLLRQVTSVAA